MFRQPILTMSTLLVLSLTSHAAERNRSAAQEPPRQVVEDKDHRCVQWIAEGVCGKVMPAAELQKQKSILLPAPIESAWEKGYGVLKFEIRMTDGSDQTSYCGAGLYDKADRLIVSAQHCLPESLAEMTKGAVTFRGLPVTYIDSLTETDQVLFQVDGPIPEGMEQLEIAEAIVGEAVFARAIQEVPVASPLQSKATPQLIYFQGPITFNGTVDAKGVIAVGQAVQKSGGKAFSIDVKQTQYQILRLSPLVGEPGFSGGPVFNAFGQVVGTITSGGPALSVPGQVTGVEAGSMSTWAPAATNIPSLLAKYKNQRKQ